MKTSYPSIREKPNTTGIMKKQRKYRSDTYIRYGKYANQWVALTSDEDKLLGHSSHLVSLHHQIAKKQGYKDARFVHIPPPNTNFAFFNF